MKTFLKWLVFLPLALAVLAFAVFNRQIVTVIPDVPEFSFEAPLFAVMFASGALGVVAGGFATWLGQGKHRRAAREARAEAARLRAMVPQPPPGLPGLSPRQAA
jgi:uncharacterized integral membrane protein